MTYDSRKKISNLHCKFSITILGINSFTIGFAYDNKMLLYYIDYLYIPLYIFLDKQNVIN